MGKKDELIEAKRSFRTLEGRDILIIHHQGVFYALDSYCYREYTTLSSTMYSCRANVHFYWTNSKISCYHRTFNTELLTYFFYAPMLVTAMSGGFMFFHISGTP